jgi:predicted HAD superfamily Cof-like phosphohydrolase
VISIILKIRYIGDVPVLNSLELNLNPFKGGVMAHNEFYKDIEKFNQIYKLQSHDTPTVLEVERIKNFQSILAEEVEEASDIADKYEKLAQENGGELSKEDKIEVLTDMSDWLGDCIVYCASEARRWGIPLSDVLNVIMQSNFSKLDADGNPIYDERGKVMKGPGYWKPEPKIKEIIADQ